MRSSSELGERLRALNPVEHVEEYSEARIRAVIADITNTTAAATPATTPAAATDAATDAVAASRIAGYGDRVDLTPRPSSGGRVTMPRRAAWVIAAVLVVLIVAGVYAVVGSGPRPGSSTAPASGAGTVICAVTVRASRSAMTGTVLEATRDVLLARLRASDVQSSIDVVDWPPRLRIRSDDPGAVATACSSKPATLSGAGTIVQLRPATPQRTGAIAAEAQAPRASAGQTQWTVLVHTTGTIDKINRLTRTPITVRYGATTIATHDTLTVTAQGLRISGYFDQTTARAVANYICASVVGLHTV